MAAECAVIGHYDRTMRSKTELKEQLAAGDDYNRLWTTMRQNKQVLACICVESWLILVELRASSSMGAILAAPDSTNDFKKDKGSWCGVVGKGSFIAFCSWVSSSETNGRDPLASLRSLDRTLL